MPQRIQKINERTLLISLIDARRGDMPDFYANLTTGHMDQIAEVRIVAHAKDIKHVGIRRFEHLLNFLLSYPIATVKVPRSIPSFAVTTGYLGQVVQAF